MNNKELIRRIISLIVTTTFLFVSTYIWFNYRTIRTNVENQYSNNNRYLDIEEVSNSLENLFPVTDEEGLKGEGSIIKVKNSSKNKIKYRLMFVPTKGNTLDNKFIKYSYNLNGGNYSNPQTINNNLIAIDNISSKDINTYNLKIWIDYDATNDIMNKVFSYRIGLESI